MLKLKLKLRNITCSFGKMDIETLKAAMFGSKSPRLKDDDVTTEKCLVKCQLEEETMERRMKGIFTGKGD